MMIGTEVYKNHRKAFFGKEISSRYNSAFGAGDRNKPTSDFPKWVENAGIVLEGKSFSFHRHERSRRSMRPGSGASGSPDPQFYGRRGWGFSWG